jgi:broad specificity phosphatase PhoE
MSLLLVRHGQASAGSDDYDRLSGRGHEQSRRLGAWLAASGHHFDHVLLGGMRRHAQTLEALAEGYGQPLPEAHVDPGFAEFDHHAVFSGFSRAQPAHPAVAAVAREGLAAMAPLIHAALEAWAEDRVGEVPESWQAFGERVRAAGDRLSRATGRALVVTSGGVIARLAQSALGANDRAAVDLNLSLRNSGFCEFRARPRAGADATGWSGIGLASWNAVPHLHDARELWTYY